MSKASKQKEKVKSWTTVNDVIHELLMQDQDKKIVLGVKTEHDFAESYPDNKPEIVKHKYLEDTVVLQGVGEGL